MKKKSSAFAILLFCFLLASCTSTNVKKATEAYENKDYVAVVELIGNEKDLDEESSKILAISKANISYTSKEYLETLRHLSAIPEGNTFEIYSDSIENFASEALKSGNYSMLVSAIEEFPDIGVFVVDEIISGCEDFDFASFQALDNLESALDDCAAKDTLLKYSVEHGTDRAKAFLVGKWQWQTDPDDPNSITIINNSLYKGRIVSCVEVVADHMLPYKHVIGEQYLDNFDFIDECNFTCTTLLKTWYEYSMNQETEGFINYQNDSFQVHIPSPDGFSTTTPDRVWFRVVD